MIFFYYRCILPPLFLTPLVRWVVVSVEWTDNVCASRWVGKSPSIVLPDNNIWSQKLVWLLAVSTSLWSIGEPGQPCDHIAVSGSQLPTGFSQSHKLLLKTIFSIHMLSSLYTPPPVLSLPKNNIKLVACILTFCFFTFSCLQTSPSIQHGTEVESPQFLH